MEKAVIPRLEAVRRMEPPPKVRLPVPPALLRQELALELRLVAREIELHREGVGRGAEENPVTPVTNLLNVPLALIPRLRAISPTPRLRILPPTCCLRTVPGFLTPA